MDYYYGPDAKQIRADRRDKRKKMQKHPKHPFCQRKYDNVNKFSNSVGLDWAGTYRFARRECKAQMQEFFEPPSNVSVRDQKEKKEADTAIKIPARWVDLTRKLRLADLTRKVYAAKNAFSLISNEDQLLSDLDYGSFSSKQRRAERRERPKSRQARNGSCLKFSNDPTSRKYQNMLEFTPKFRLKANRARDLDIKEEIAAVLEIETPEDVPIEQEDTPLEQNGVYTEETLLKLYLESNNSPRHAYSLDILDFKPPKVLEADDLFTSLARDIDNTLHQFCNWAWSALIF